MIAELVKTAEGQGAELRVRDGRLELRGALPAHLRQALRDEREAVIQWLVEREHHRSMASRRQVAINRRDDPKLLPPAGDAPARFFRGTWTGDDWWNGPGWIDEG